MNKCNMDCFNCQFDDCINDSDYSITELKEFDAFIDKFIIDDSSNNEKSVDRYNHSQKGRDCRKRYLKSDKGRAAQKRYANSEAAKEKRKISNAKNIDSIRKSKREYYKRNKEKIKEYNKKYYQMKKEMLANG